MSAILFLNKPKYTAPVPKQELIWLRQGMTLLRVETEANALAMIEAGHGHVVHECRKEIRRKLSLIRQILKRLPNPLDWSEESGKDAVVDVPTRYYPFSRLYYFEEALTTLAETKGLPNQTRAAVMAMIDKHND